MYSKESIASNIRAERARANLTQSELASITGISETSIRLYESAEVMPGFDKVIAIADALNCTTNKLAGRE